MALDILRKFVIFCLKRDLRGEVCLTGGNPFLYPGFFDLYHEIARLGFSISILGNPVSEGELAEAVSIKRPSYYQVSLEGLEDQDNAMRGEGHFNKTIEFIGLLRKHQVHSHVMLTLTHKNIDEVIPLTEILSDIVDHFTFNRLSQTGEGKSIETVTKKELVALMQEYIHKSKTNKSLRFKDNLFNIFRYHYQHPLMRGCTGYGCGAAFNFVALLPDGEVHACRKFPSMIGNILESKFDDIYHSPSAKTYRRGPSACRFCPIRNNCGGCLAVSHNQGIDIFKQRDPHCFMNERQSLLS